MSSRTINPSSILYRLQWGCKTSPLSSTHCRRSQKRYLSDSNPPSEQTIPGFDKAIRQLESRIDHQANLASALRPPRVSAKLARRNKFRLRVRDLFSSVNATNQALERLQSTLIPMPPKPDLVAFFDGSKGDYKDRVLSRILQWSDQKLEASHDYIQTLFPLPEASGVNWNAPIITQEVFEAFRAQPELRASLRNAFTKILSFYGLKLKEDPLRVCESQGVSHSHQ